MTPNDETKAAWVAVDWGTSHLRLWPISVSGAPLCRIDSEQGMGRLTKEEYEKTLFRLLEPYIDPDLGIDVLCCGMVGARQGWCEAPYIPTPCSPTAPDTPIRAPTVNPRLRVHIVAGVKQMEPPDVMRGEETQVAGILSSDPDMDGVICLPGTHTKWVSVEAGRIQGFSTFMTGELFQLLSVRSVLRHGMATKGFDRAAFEAGCRTSVASPEAIGNLLFGLRAQSLLRDLDPVAARSQASGFLLGLEVAAMRTRWRDKTTVLVGENEIAEAYSMALSVQGAIVSWRTQRRSLSRV